MNNNGHIIRNNTVRGFHFYGIYGNNSDNVIVENNTINRIGRATTTTFYGFYGVNTRNTKLRNNRIHDAGAGTYTAYPIWFSTSANQAGSETEVINNAVYNINTTGLVYGMYFSGTTDRFRIYHNTVDIDASGTGNKRAIFFSVAPNNSEFRNNIVSVDGNGTGAKHCIYVTTTSSSLISNNNVFYMGATGGTVNSLGYWTADRNTLSDWTTVSLLDSASLSTNPVYADIATGNITPLSINADNIGAPLGVLTDLSGATRSSLTPDPGALEFTGISGDIGITAASLVRQSLCYGTTDSVKLTIRNLIGTTVNFSVNPITVVYEISGPINTIDSIVNFAGSLAVGSDLTLFNSNINMSLPGKYTIRAYIRPNAVNVSQLNDTLVNTDTTEVFNILAASPKTGTAVSPTDTFVLRVQSPFFRPGNVKITEISHFKTTTGQPVGGWPSYLIADDYVELTGAANTDLAGYTFEEWSATALTHSVTFPANTQFSPDGTLVLATGQLGASVPSPRNFYYHTGNTVTHSSTTAQGYVLKDISGNIIDAVGYGTYTFPVSSGVTTSMWTGNTTAANSGIRLVAPDNDSATAWVNSSVTPQNPNVINANVPEPFPSGMAGFNWYFLGSPIDTNSQIVVGPYTTPGIYQYVAVYVNACGTFYDTVTITAASTVPVTFTTFTAKKSANDVILSWKTASEINNDYFIVQRSIDGNNFEDIGTVNGNGTTSLASNYKFVDANAVLSISVKTVYYRLKQVDKDGTFSYSKIATVTLDEQLIRNLSIYPNPTVGEFDIVFDRAQGGTVQVIINSILGTTLSEKSYATEAGVNRIRINQDLPNGVYFVIIRNEGTEAVKKVAVSK